MPLSGSRKPNQEPISIKKKQEEGKIKPTELFIKDAYFYDNVRSYTDKNFIHLNLLCF